jgi:DNA-binding transcriptional ArsR family regulator
MLKQSSELDVMFTALADPTRRAVLERLSQGPATVSELARPFAMSLPSVVQHLQVLEASGLIGSSKSGRVRTCHIQFDALSRVERWAAERRAAWATQLDRLDDYLRTQETKEEPNA